MFLYACVLLGSFFFLLKTSKKEKTGLKRFFLVSCWACLHKPIAMLVIQKQDMAGTWKTGAEEVSSSFDE